MIDRSVECARYRVSKGPYGITARRIARHAQDNE